MEAVKRGCGALPSAIDLRILAALVLVSLVVQALCIRAAATCSLDAVQYVRFAQAIQTDGLVAAVQAFDQQPLFPLWLAGVEATLVAVSNAAGYDTPVDIWATSVILAASLPLVFLPLPLYALFSLWYGRTTATLAVVFAAVVPSIARLGSEGLGDGLHLFLLAAAWALVAIRLTPPAAGATASLARSRMMHLATIAAGSVFGLAFLTRYEALLPALAAMLVIGWEDAARGRAKWRSAFVGMLSIGLGLAIILLGWNAITGRLLAKYGIAIHAVDPVVSSSREAATTTSAHGLALAALPEPLDFRFKESSVTTRRYGLLAAIGQLGSELPEAFGFAIGCLAVYGWWRLGASPRRDLDRLAIGLASVYGIVCVLYAARAGYLSERHLVPIVVCGLGVAAYGAIDLARRLAGWMPGDQQYRAPTSLPAACGGRWNWLTTGVVLSIAIGGCFPLTFAPLHAQRDGHRQAGEWLAAHGTPQEIVLDTRELSSLYSGRTTKGYDSAAETFADPRLGFVVIEARELEFDSRRAATLRLLLKRAGEHVADFLPRKRNTRRERDKVSIYRWHPERLLGE